MKRIIAFFFLFAFSYSAQSRTVTQCFAYDRETPERQPVLNSTASEIWCYQKNGNQTLIFDPDNIDEKRTSVLVNQNSNGSISSAKTLTSNSGNFVIVESFDQSIAPLNVPLTLDRAAQIGQRVAITLGPNDQQDLSTIYRDYSNSTATVINKSLYQISEGESEHFLPESRQPWVGHHFDYSQRNMWSGFQPPLTTYDQIIKVRTGVDPESRVWEQAYHSLDYVPWGGHCNGWAAAAVLYNEPSTVKWSDELQQKIEISTQKGWLVESSFCVRWSFYGRRYRQTGDDLNEIDPAKFHKVLLYFLKAQNRPVAMDYFNDDSVDNAVITGYKFEIEKDPQTPNRYKIVTTLKVHEYQQVRTEDVGIAGSSDWVYEYFLNTTPTGLIVDGEWAGSRSNPDFLWVPLAQSQCGRENPRITHRWVEKLIREMPDYNGQDQINSQQ